MASPDMTSQYMNTLVFAVVAGIISLMLMLLVMYASESVREYSVFIVTVEIGLVLIIAVAIYRIIAFERRHSTAMKIGPEMKLPVSTCPDYWTNVDGDLCVNTFNVSGQNYRYRITGDAKAKPDQNVRISDYNGQQINKACILARAKVTAPWTDVKAVCDSYRL